ncbi:Nucleic-acid-binding protein from transposon X-element, partial [Stegodyphus mimosarum]
MSFQMITIPHFRISVAKAHNYLIKQREDPDSYLFEMLKDIQSLQNRLNDGEDVSEELESMELFFLDDMNEAGYPLEKFKQASKKKFKKHKKNVVTQNSQKTSSRSFTMTDNNEMDIQPFANISNCNNRQISSVRTAKQCDNTLANHKVSQSNKISSLTEHSLKEQQSNERSRFPPVFFPSDINWCHLLGVLKKYAVSDFLGVLRADSIKVNFKTPEARDKAIICLTKENVQYHTFRLKKDTPIKVVMHGIPACTPEQDIFDELHKLKIPVCKIKQFTRKRNKSTERLPIFFLELPRSNEGKKIFNIKSVFGTDVRVARFKARKIPIQCFRCQRFGHGQLTCFNTPRCLKCAKEHLTYTCSLGKEEKATCIRCSGNHPASFHGCPKFPKFHSFKKK